ncbi:TauD/TfdA dioxygenase family protein [Peribacillus frigoritolerans]|uniref:TauD/TfdA dioxygenase family protein n=1 Tax=Peribacillus frigoritolerans TaxID=450367 RepID=UPI0022804B94|nr:TauD/TfdA family dioxygenase [Peribacillus frigoritolerans]MCY9005669.1 TauD/TfdA family dioxygenase [Peribacillus frigoritolerans]MDP9742814.1 alpha-ketoglutarate-dependent taurine dioxygenase [Bacillus sp. B2I3]MED3831953.1 TauD/TfdA family dioxygenase [Peribacillus frigoritolerans]MED3845685.1 TauD/TfdA family dioxygenase [Peribacillus frigoritolerans]
MTETKTQQLKVVPVAGRIGAEIQGVQLSGDLDLTIFNEIKQALNDHKVIFFKGQNHLDDASQEAFAKLLGEPYAHPTVPVKDNTNYIFELDSERGAKANHWHTDVTFVPEVPKYSVLRGVTIPDVGGDTVWANTNEAYEDLPDGLKKLADELWAIHTNEYDYAQFKPAENIDDEVKKKYRDIFESTIYKTRHPVVHVHAETGKRHLLLGGFAGRVEGYTTSESERLLSIFDSYVTRLENTVRWQWSEGDVAIWDNLATQHYAIADYGNQHRVVRRVTVGKDVPVNKENESSRLIVKK